MEMTSYPKQSLDAMTLRCSDAGMPLSQRDSESSAKRFERDAIPLRDQLYRVARRYTRSHSDAEDLVQETLLKAYAAFPRFEEGNIRAWLFTIMNHTWINNYRAAKRRPAEWLAGDVSETLTSEVVTTSTGVR